VVKRKHLIPGLRVIYTLILEYCMHIYQCKGKIKALLLNMHTFNHSLQYFMDTHVETTKVKESMRNIFPRGKAAKT
jgi:hypothetical protein